MVGRAYLQAGTLDEAERHLRVSLAIQLSLGSPECLISVSPLTYALSQFYLAEALQRAGKADQAIEAYRDFLSHFANSNAHLPQIAQAREALARLHAQPSQQ